MANFAYERDECFKVFAKRFDPIRLSTVIFYELV